jgi:beta-N-acetylhexosaminidase
MVPDVYVGEKFGAAMHPTRLFLQLVALLTTLVSLSCAATAPTRAATQPTPNLETMVGQMLMAGFRGFTVTNDSPIIRDIRQSHLGGVILFDYDVALVSPNRNIESPAQVRALTTALQAASDTPLFVAVDQEGGRVQRLKPKRGFPGSPSARELGAMPDAAVRDAGTAVGVTLRDLGFNLDFAPVADVDVDPDSPVIGRLGRSFSPDPVRVGQCDELFLEGLASKGIIGCLKHFPGHGSAGTDSHLGVTDVTATWSRAELLPYRRLIDANKATMIMTGHLFNAHLDPNYPATLSQQTITGLLRGQLGYDGVVVSDDMNMKAITDRFGMAEAVRLAIEAGADILVFGNNLVYDPTVVGTVHGLIMTMVRDGVIPQARIAQSYKRIMRLKAGLGRP